MKNYTASQKQALDKRRLNPVWLLDIVLQNSGPTLHFSDRNIIVGSTLYEDYLEDLSGLGAQLRRRNSETLNLDVTLRFKNSRFKSYNHLIEIGDAYPFEGASATIKRIYLDDNNAPSDAETVEKVVLDEPADIDLMSFICRASSMPFAMDELWVQATINKTDYPNADPDDLNKVRNIIYGSCEGVRCHAVDAGWASPLAEDIDALQTTIKVTDASDAPATPFETQLEDEKIYVSNISNNQLSVTRAYGGTTASAHDKGQTVYEIKTEYVYLICDHPVKSIRAVYVDKIRQTAGYTAYTGQPGDEHGSYPGKAVISFSVKPVIRKQVNLSTIKSGSANNGTLNVSDNISYQSSETDKEIYPNGGTSEYRDGNLATKNQGGSVSFPSTSYGNITSQDLWVYRCYATGSNITVSGGFSGTIGIAQGWHRISKSGGSWSDGASFSSGGDIGEVYKVVHYTPNLSKTGGAYKSGNVSDNIQVSLTGNSSADVVIGSSINCDVDGYQDDSSGSYTGTPNALIERPDHIFKHFIDVLYGFSLSDIDTTSFSSAGSSYASAISGGYKFAFVIDSEIVPSKYLQQLAFQCRSTIRYTAGKWYLEYLPDTAPTPAKTIYKSDLAGEHAKFVFNKTDRRDIENDLEARFQRNYGRLRHDESEWLGTSKASDSASQTKYGVRAGKYDFFAIRDQAMADHVLSFILKQVKVPLITVKAPVFWEHLDLEVGDTFDISNDFYNGRKFYIEEIRYLDKFTGEIIGLEWW